MKNVILPLILSLLLSWGFYSCSSSNSANNEKGSIYYTYGTEKLVEKDYTHALELLLQAEQQLPHDSKVNNNLGMAYYFKGRVQQALEHIERAISLDPNNMEAYNNKASIFLAQKKYDLAEKQYNLILENIYYRQQYRTYYNLGVIKLEQGKISEAANYFKKSIAESADYCPPYFQLGQIQEQMLQFSQAIKTYTEGLQGSCYNYPASHYQIALIHQKLGKPLLAQSKFQEILTKFPNSTYSALAETQLAKLRPKDYSDSNADKVENTPINNPNHLAPSDVPNPAT